MKFKGIILLTSVCLISIAGISQTDGRIGFYPLDGHAHDLSPTKNHGRMTGAVPAVDRFNRPGHAIRVNAGMGATIAGAAFANPVYTLSLWVNVRVIQPRGQSAIALFIGDESTRGLGLGLDNAYSGTTAFGWGFGSFALGTRKVFAGQTMVLPAPGRWYQLVLVRSPASLSFYVDAELVSQVQVDLPQYYGDPVVCWLGTNFRKQHFDGSLDDLLIYNRPFSSEEVKAQYQESLKHPSSL